MVALPGVHYLVASATDQEEARHSIVIYAVDLWRRLRPIVMTKLSTKAYQLCARYATIRGERSIAIAYTGRYGGGTATCSVPPSQRAPIAVVSTLEYPTFRTSLYALRVSDAGYRKEDRILRGRPSPQGSELKGDSH
ncbi:hypothetical protein BD413DRAFT_140895 [Trametes elegans]|nr:hypothetical protein BD413DRAFT_140895 [Trametes elegans]